MEAPLEQRALWIKTEPLLTRMLDTETIASLSDENLKHYLTETIDQFERKSDLHFSDADRQFLQQQLLNETKGFGPIESLMQDSSISDILINGPKQVYIERNGQLTLTPIQFRDREHILHLLMRALANSGRRVDTAKPYVDVILADGSRLNAIIAPLVNNDPVVSIRKFQYDRFSLKDLEKEGAISPEGALYLSRAVRAHLNMIIVGGIAAGKTTLLNALLQEVQPHERIVLIEETSELELKNKHAIHMQTRIPNIEGYGEITQRDLLRNSLRMRPDRIVVGEIRGPEVLEMFQAMNIGYDGSLSTVHASSIEDLGLRLISLSALTGYNLPPHFIYRQLAETIHVVVQLGRFHDGARRVIRISEISGLKENEVLYNDVYRHVYDQNQQKYNCEFYAQNARVLTVDRARQYGLFAGGSPGDYA